MTFELRDEDGRRFLDRGVEQAIANVKRGDGELTLGLRRPRAG